MKKIFLVFHVCWLALCQVFSATAAVREVSQSYQRGNAWLIAGIFKKKLLLRVHVSAVTFPLETGGAEELINAREFLVSYFSTWWSKGHSTEVREFASGVFVHDTWSPPLDLLPLPSPNRLQFRHTTSWPVCSTSSSPAYHSGNRPPRFRTCHHTNSGLEQGSHWAARIPV